MHREQYTLVAFKLVDKCWVLFRYLITKTEEIIHTMKSLLMNSFCADTYTSKDRMQTSNALQKKYSGSSDTKITLF